MENSLRKFANAGDPCLELDMNKFKEYFQYLHQAIEVDYEVAMNDKLDILIRVFDKRDEIVRAFERRQKAGEVPKTLNSR